MNKSIICLILLFCSGSTTAAGPADLTPDAPDRYVVVRGDTLWAISKRFLSDPWRWPNCGKRIRTRFATRTGFILATSSSWNSRAPKCG
jgi:hypothetical protein